MRTRFCFVLLWCAIALCTIWGTAFSVATPCAVAEEMISIGVATADITPPIPFRLSGYFNERLSTGTKDPLQVKAIVFEQGNTRVVLAICDVISLDGHVPKAIRKQVHERLNIPEEAVIVTGTHTHTGPLYNDVLADFLHQQAIQKSDDGTDPAQTVDYAEQLVSTVVECIVQASKQVQPSTFAVGTIDENRLSFNRRFHMKNSDTVVFNPGVKNPQIDRAAGPIDPEVTMLLFTQAGQDKPFVSFTNFALHLDTTGGTLYSADYPFYLSNVLQKQYGENFVSVFGTGTCGDINHIDVTADQQRGASEIGTMLGETVRDAQTTLKQSPRPMLGWAYYRLPVKVQTFTKKELTASKAMLPDIVTEGGKKTFLERVRATTVLDLAQNFSEGETTLLVQAVTLDADTAIVAIPGEVFVEIGLAIKKASPFKYTAVVELSGQNVSYVPTAKAFSEGSYETVNSRIMPGEGERLVEAATAALQSLKSMKP